MKLYDLHTHTTMSDGSLTPTELAAKAEEHGCGLGISDHLFCCKLLTPRDIDTYLTELESLGVLRGLEANMGENFTLPAALDNRLDYMIASVHTVKTPDGGRMPLNPYFCARAGDAGAPPYTAVFTADEAKFYLTQIIDMIAYDFAIQRVDIYGHCTVTPFHDTLKNDPWLLGWEDEVISLCLKSNVAMEISGLWECPRESMVQKALARGVKFTLGSDCHTPAHTCNLAYPSGLIAKLNIPETQIYMPKRR